MGETSRLFKGVLFDLDDTLIDRDRAFQRWLRRFYDDEPAVGAASTFEEAARLLTEWDLRGTTPKDVFFQRVLEAWPGIGAAVPELVDRFWREFVEGIQPDERVLSFLRDVTAARVPWGIVTNGGPYQFDKLRRARIDGMPQFVLASELFGCAKPDRRIFEEALLKLGLPADQVLFVGDNPATDILGAQGAGISSAWMRQGRHWPSAATPPDYEIDHVWELAPMLLK